jgi:hypothetical protein
MSSTRYLAVLGAVGLLAAGTFAYVDPVGAGGAYAASPEQKGQARQEFNQLVQILPGIDTAYASGNTAEAQSKYDNAKEKWAAVSSAISAREAREVQLLFESLGNKLANKAPPRDIKRTVHGMLEELNEDIKSELR